MVILHIVCLLLVVALTLLQYTLIKSEVEMSALSHGKVSASSSPSVLVASHCFDVQLSNSSAAVTLLHPDPESQSLHPRARFIDACRVLQHCDASHEAANAVLTYSMVTVNI